MTDRPESSFPGSLGARASGRDSGWPRPLGEGRPGLGYPWPPPLGGVPEDRGVLGQGRPGTESSGRLPLSAAIVFATLLLAVVLSGAAVYQVFSEYHLLGDWLTRPERVS